MAGTSRQAIDELTTDWPTTPREAAQTVMGKYGPPDEASDHLLIWHRNGPWKYTVLSREETPHNFPTSHHDVLQQVIDYPVPADRFSDLAAFDGSVIVERTRGELSARCEGEEMNFLALNLAHDLLEGRFDVAEARAQYTAIARAFRAGESHAYVQGLRFQVPQGGTGDTDEMTLEETMLNRAGRALGVTE